MNSNIYLFIVLFAVFVNVYICPILNTETTNPGVVLSYVQIKSVVGHGQGSSSNPSSDQGLSSSPSSSSGLSTSQSQGPSTSSGTGIGSGSGSLQGPLSPNERKRKLSSDSHDSDSQHSARRLRVDEGEAPSCFNTLEFLSESLRDVQPIDVPKQATEEQLLEMMLLEFEKNGVSRDDVTSEDLATLATTLAKQCYKNWKKVKKSLRSLELSLSELEEKRKCCNMLDDDELRSFTEFHLEIVNKQELIVQLERDIASNYKNYLLIREKFNRPRRSQRILNARQSAMASGSSSASGLQTSQSPDYDPELPQPGPSHSFPHPQQQSDQSHLLQHPHSISRPHTRASQSGRGTSPSTRAQSGRKRHRRRRRRF
ncbi:putative signal peptide-containing protein [Cryptosporidium canis]|uniref:Signal peptide-containing protein n=1 Tax=Cryptosporidium canis TaxID=195482 RepID=A0A9D5HUW7_9CRYT|nr:putative signal peptide-containing protein [Cryptosporidium canis]